MGMACITKIGIKRWWFRYKVDGKPRKLPLGYYPEVTLEEAREETAKARALLRNKDNRLDPLVVRDATRAEKQLKELESKKLEAEAREKEELLRVQLAQRKTMNELFEMWDKVQGVHLNSHWRDVRRSLWRCHIAPVIGASYIENASDVDLLKHTSALEAERKSLKSFFSNHLVFRL